MKAIVTRSLVLSAVLFTSTAELARAQFPNPLKPQEVIQAVTSGKVTPDPTINAVREIVTTNENVNNTTKDIGQASKDVGKLAKAGQREAEETGKETRETLKEMREALATAKGEVAALRAAVQKNLDAASLPVVVLVWSLVALIGVKILGTLFSFGRRRPA